VEAEQAGDVAPRVRRTEDRADELLLVHRQLEQVHADRVGGERRDCGLHHPPALGGHRQRRLDVLAAGDAHGEDHLVGHRPPREIRHECGGLLDARRAVRRTEDLRVLALELDRIDRDHVARAGH
jgi:hypothetical protein